MAQNLAFVGLSYSSPIVAIGMGCLTPSISFILAVICRGPVVKQAPAIVMTTRLFVFLSPHENWVLGCALFAAASLSYAIWNIIQVETLEKCPDAMTVASSCSLFGTFQSALVAIIIERDRPAAWRLQFDMGLLVIVLTAIFGSVIKSNVHMWCAQRKSQMYVIMFKPLGVPIAAMFGCLFFAQTFHYGSLMASAITGIGYYTTMWGQIRENKTKGPHDLLEDTAPLLQQQQQQQV
ncbi:hypothetical protein R6Q57_022304 [Mikania cordata]